MNKPYTAAAIKLSLHFDPRLLAADIDGLAPEDWVPHFNTAYYEGSWAGAPLIGPAGETHPIRQLHPDPGCSAFAETETLGRCPNTRSVLRQFDCTIRSARFLRLGPGARIREHTDHDLAFEDGEVRLHLPISTHAGVTFRLNSKPVSMLPGELWYLNVNLPHEVKNDSASDRTHLVMDCIVNDWLTDLFVSSSQE